MQTSSVRVTFCGATKTVTGSKYLIETDASKILVDCGIFQGKKELREKNWQEPPFAVDTLDAVVLTHAHIDHTGYLPVLTRRGFRGPIYCTAATASFIRLLLPDSAHLQEEEARFANEHGSTKHQPALPLYSQKDVAQVLTHLRVFDRDVATKVTDSVTVRGRGAGHMLGSVSLTFDIGGRRLNFSGDIGRFDSPILPDPVGIELGDLLVCESTYGDRVHAVNDIPSELAHVVHSAVERKGALLIPAFAIGRTQTLLYYLAKLEREGKIPVLPIYVDSPMAVDATAIYQKFPGEYDEEALATAANGSPLCTEKTQFCRSSAESKQINSTTGARIIISAAGMITGGRILHHLLHTIHEASTTLLFVGYQAEGTRGRLLQAGAGEIKIFGQHIPVRAQVCTISGLSGHGDKNELQRWLRLCTGQPGLVRITHGEVEPSTAFARELRERFSWNAQPAEYLETVEL